MKGGEKSEQPRWREERQKRSERTGWSCRCRSVTSSGTVPPRAKSHPVALPSVGCQWRSPSANTSSCSQQCPSPSRGWGQSLSPRTDSAGGASHPKRLCIPDRLPSYPFVESLLTADGLGSRRDSPVLPAPTPATFCSVYGLPLDSGARYPTRLPLLLIPPSRPVPAGVTALACVCV